MERKTTKEEREESFNSTPLTQGSETDEELRIRACLAKIKLRRIAMEYGNKTEEEAIIEPPEHEYAPIKELEYLLNEN
jgi:hypothetical protein